MPIDPPRDASRPRWRARHRGVLSFALPHLADHVVGLAGPAVHSSVLAKLWVVYRSPLGEPLLAGIAVQVCLGLMLAWSARHVRRDRAGEAQLWSGAYLAFFVLQHVAAALYTRAVPRLDTNLFWAASVVRAMPSGLYYLPYHALAPLALGTHEGIGLGSALAPRLGERGAQRLRRTCIALGFVTSFAVVAALVGAVHPFELPANTSYREVPARRHAAPTRPMAVHHAPDARASGRARLESAVVTPPCRR